MQQPGPTLRVMCYNIHSSRDDLGALATVVRAEQPDVVVVQEGPRRFRWRAKIAALARDWRLVHAAGGLWSLGNLVMVDLRVSTHETWSTQFPLTPGRHLRGTVFARCSVRGVGFTVVGCHLATDPVERPVQATLLKKQLAELQEPVIFAGDLNDEPGGTAWRTVADGLIDSAEVTGAGDRPTFSIANPRRRIDAILVDPRCTVLSYRVVDSPEVRRASDHFPLVAEIALPV